MPLKHEYAVVNGVKLHYVTAGDQRRVNGQKPLVLLHGYPQSWYLWRRVIARLEEKFFLVMPDLRGYGDSAKPLDGYDKRTMAADIRSLAEHLQLEKFGLVAHDRGARVAHRYALDHGATLDKLMLLDIEPTRTVFDNMNQEIAMSTWHWLFLPVPDLAEEMISKSPDSWLRYLFRSWAGNPGAIDEDAFNEYLRVFKIPGTIRATCADYRAGASIDLTHDREDESARIDVPLRILWGGRWKRNSQWDVVKVWEEKAHEVSGRAIENSGHFIPEESPEELSEEILGFFSAPQTMFV